MNTKIYVYQKNIFIMIYTVEIKCTTFGFPLKCKWTGDNDKKVTIYQSPKVKVALVMRFVFK